LWLATIPCRSWLASESGLTAGIDVDSPVTIAVSSWVRGYFPRINKRPKIPQAAIF
jgi:hypothetical protein